MQLSGITDERMIIQMDYSPEKIGIHAELSLICLFFDDKTPDSSWKMSRSKGKPSIMWSIIFLPIPLEAKESSAKCHRAFSFSPTRTRSKGKQSRIGSSIFLSFRHCQIGWQRHHAKQVRAAIDNILQEFDQMPRPPALPYLMPEDLLTGQME